MDQAKLARMQASVRIGYVYSVQVHFHPGLSIPGGNEFSKCNTRIRQPIVRLRILDSRFSNLCDGAISQILNRIYIYRIAQRIHGKGTPRRKVKKVVRNSGADDKKLQAALKKLNVQPIQGIEEVNMFKEDGNVIHFANPRVHGAVPSNTFALYGNGEEKELTELVPNILNQLGPDSLASLRKLAESYQNMQKQQGDKKDDEEDDIPDLVEGENFETKE
ncbi:unnamed protein product [Penicillium egyptiacum]|uniref:Nascent polypeptide-associated complex subunit beta n=1 Tax=Penicillium egyptiacum TaxID=1303716 RepID=A0A9W4KAS3_9EURO|nr:unnamed protein product [Penicillium egyptiacum]